eukprot:Filipodium_phascolosomae@DN2221_c0_g1_i1.p1
MAFVTYPVGLGQLPVPQLWTVLFMLVLLNLGIDSAYTFVDAFVEPWHESYLFRDTPRWKIIFATITIGILGCLFFCMDIGFALVDLTDWFLSHLGLQVYAFSKSACAGWFYRPDSVREKLGSLTSQYVLAAGMFGGMVILSILTLAIKGNMMFLGPGIGGAIIIGSLVAGLLIGANGKGQDPTLTKGQKAYWAFMGGMEQYRIDANAVIGKPARNKCLAFLQFHQLSVFWGFMTRFFVPLVGIFLISIDLQSTITDFYKPRWNRHYKAVSLAMVGICYIMTLFGVLWPNGPVVTALLGSLDGPAFEWSWKNFRNLRMDSHAVQPNATAATAKQVAVADEETPTPEMIVTTAVSPASQVEAEHLLPHMVVPADGSTVV